VGAEAAFRVLLPAAGVHVGLGLLGGCYGLAAVGAAVVLGCGRRMSWVLPVAAAAAIGFLACTALPRLPVFIRTATFNVVEVRSGREGSLAVVERADLGRGMFFDNLYLLGATRAAPDMARQAHLPLLLHSAPRRVGFIGLGTGITASGALSHGAVDSIVAVELSRLVADAAARHFREANRAICEHPKVEVRVEDAGTYFAAAPGRFEAVIGDLFTPWRPGEARLCSLEQFRAVREALAPGGVFCQWLPMSQLTDDGFRTIAATFKAAFGTVHVFRNHFRTKSVPVALVGFKDGGLDWESVARQRSPARGSRTGRPSNATRDCHSPGSGCPPA
jgi:spermidine synthase